MLEGAPASPASDTYSFGIVLWELLTWRVPWASLSQAQQWRVRSLPAACFAAWRGHGLMHAGTCIPAPHCLSHMHSLSSSPPSRQLPLDIVAGARPEVPPLEELPGEDTPKVWRLAANWQRCCQSLLLLLLLLLLMLMPPPLLLPLVMVAWYR